MSSGNWTNNDGLFLQFGTAKATAEIAGDYQAPGSPNRIVEARINLANLTTSATIISNTYFFPAGQGIFVEKVEVEPEIAAGTTTGTLSVGLIQNDRATTDSTFGATAFVKALTAGPTLATAGLLTTLTANSTGAGSMIGSYSAQYNTNNITSGSINSVGGYLTATLGTTLTTGQVLIRIHYHGVGTIIW